MLALQKFTGKTVDLKGVQGVPQSELQSKGVPIKSIGHAIDEENTRLRDFLRYLHIFALIQVVKWFQDLVAKNHGWVLVPKASMVNAKPGVPIQVPSGITICLPVKVISVIILLLLSLLVLYLGKRQESIVRMLLYFLS